MEPYSTILEAIENNEDYASVIAEMEQKFNEIPQKIEKANSELAALREEENSYNTYLPSFQAALSATQSHLSILSKNNINEVRSFVKPPKTVEKIAEGVLILLGYKVLAWDTFRKIAADQLLSSLHNYDIQSVSKSTINNLKPIIDEFQGHEEAIRNVSTAAFGLWNWVFGIYQASQLFSQFRSIGQIRAEINEKNQEIADLQQEMINGASRIESLKEKIEKINSA